MRPARSTSGAAWWPSRWRRRAAWVGRREAGREAGWLAWPLVVLLGLKLLLEDFQRGRPATLILSLAFAGAALILVPRLRARATAAAPSAAGPAAG